MMYFESRFSGMSLTKRLDKRGNFSKASHSPLTGECTIRSISPKVYRQPLWIHRIQWGYLGVFQTTRTWVFPRRRIDIGGTWGPDRWQTTPALQNSGNSPYIRIHKSASISPQSSIALNRPNFRSYNKAYPYQVKNRKEILLGCPGFGYAP